MSTEWLEENPTLHLNCLFSISRSAFTQHYFAGVKYYFITLWLFPIEIRNEISRMFIENADCNAHNAFVRRGNLAAINFKQWFQFELQWNVFLLFAQAQNKIVLIGIAAIHLICLFLTKNICFFLRNHSQLFASLSLHRVEQLKAPYISLPPVFVVVGVCDYSERHSLREYVISLCDLS
jgi:hypothetical protein